MFDDGGASSCIAQGFGLIILSMLLFFAGVFLFVVVHPFLPSVPVYCWILLGVTIIGLVVWRLFLKSKPKGVFRTVAILLLLLNGVIFSIGIVDNPTFTVMKFCMANSNYWPTGGIEPVSNELTPRGKAKYDGFGCTGDNGDFYNISHRSENTFYMLLGNPGGLACYQVTLVQGDWGTWLIDDFTEIGDSCSG